MCPMVPTRQRIGYTPNRLHMDMDLWHRALGGFGGEPFPSVKVDFPDRAPACYFLDRRRRVWLTPTILVRRTQTI